jgi:hypothetical protein
LGSETALCFERQGLSVILVINHNFYRTGLKKLQQLIHNITPPASPAKLPHRANARIRQDAALLLEMKDNIFNRFAQLGVQSYQVVAMNFGYQRRAFAYIYPVLPAPLHPFVISIDYFHFFTISMT